jgi:transposase
MKTVAPLTEAEHITLTAAYHDGPWPIFRQRAHAMLLSDKGYAREAIADILSVNRATVSLWIDAWEAKGIAGLRDGQRPGRPPIYDAAELARLRALVDEQPHQLKAAQARLEAETGKAACTMTLKRGLKKIRV